MKKILFATLLLFAGSAFAFEWPRDDPDPQGTSQEQAQDQRQTQFQGQDQSVYNRQDLDANAKALSGSVSDSNAKAYSGSHSGSTSSSGSHSGSQALNHGDQLTTITTQFEAVSASAAALDLPYCGEGISAQGDEGGFGMANTNFICESNMALKMSLLLVEMEIASYDSTGVDDHLVRANEYMLDAKSIVAEVVNYIQDRSDTASMAATTKDLAWPTLLIGLLVLAL